MTTSHTGSATTPLLFAGQYHDNESGLYYLRARIYDPTTAQFLTVDPAAATTRTRYGYTPGDPLNYTDPSGLYCTSGVAVYTESGEVCNGLSEVANNIYHPIRAAVTVVPSLAGRAANIGTDAKCQFDSQEWATICSDGRTILGAGASTFGTTINTRMSPTAFHAANNGRLLAHEVKHSDQWLLFGMYFSVLDTQAAAWDYLVHSVTDCPIGQDNVFERWAGLADGGYR